MTSCGRPGLSAADAEALAGLGIDLDAVLTRAEAELGAGALDGTRIRGRRRSRLRLSSGAALTLQAALKQAALRGDGELREDHLLLGLTGRRSLVADALGARGINRATVLAALPPAGRTC